MDLYKNISLKNSLFILIILIGISFKFYRLDYKMFWYDEISTIIQVRGANTPLQIDSTKLNQIAPISHYQGLLRHSDAPITIGSEISAQLHCLNLNPLHYALLSFWYRAVGATLVDYRLFSVFIFLITLPFLFGLVKELFNSNQAGWIAVSFFSISPFIHYFSQEARYYILWTFMLIAIHYFLLKAVNNNKQKWWIGYILFGALSVYTSVLSAFIIFEHVLFVFFLKKNARIKFISSIGIIFLLYLPWLIYVFINREDIYQALSWHKFDTVPLWAPLLGLLLGLARTFSFYLNYTLFWEDVFNNITNAMIIETFINIGIIIMIILSMIKLLKKETKETSWFLLLIIVPGLLFFWALDIARNSITTHWFRYYIFNTIPVILLITYFVNSLVQSKKTLFMIIYLSLVSIGIYSIFTISKYKYWYLGGDWQQEFVDNSILLSKPETTLLITDFTRMNNPWEGPLHTMEVLVNCTSEKIDVLRLSPNAQQINRIISEKQYANVYVIYASDQLLANLKVQFGNKLQLFQPKHGPPNWRILVE